MSTLEPEINNNKRLDFAGVFFLFIFMVLCFVLTDNSTREVAVFHIKANRLVIIMGISAFFIFVSFFKKQRIDKITGALLVSATLGILPYSYSDYVGSYWGNYFPLLISVIAYYICLQSKGDYVERIYRILCLVSVILSLQIIITEFGFFSGLSFGNFNNLLIKGAMNLPIGSSNLIAAYLLPIIVFLVSYKRKTLTILVTLLSTYALILCRSKNAISIILLILFFVLARKVYGYIFRDKTANRNQKLIAILAVSVFFGLLLILGLYVLNAIIVDLQFEYYSPYKNTVLNYLDSISSGRIAVYHHELIRASEHLFFGNGFGYELGQTKSHNWIIELLVQKGIVGLFIYLFCIISVFRTGLRHYKDDRFIRACIHLLLVIFIQGLFEITVFTVGIDFLIWSISGFMMARVIRIQKTNQKQITGTKLAY